MDATSALLASTQGQGTVREALNARLSAARVSITREDAEMLAELQSASLAEVEQVEFGQPAIVAIAEAVASSPSLTMENAADTLAELQSFFYALRDELPQDIPDDEIVEALCGCFGELGDASEVSCMPVDEVMAFSHEYALAADAQDESEYRIVDNDGRTYAFDPTEWDYNETASGWDGERWADDWDY